MSVSAHQPEHSLFPLFSHNNNQQPHQNGVNLSSGGHFSSGSSAIAREHGLTPGVILPFRFDILRPVSPVRSRESQVQHPTAAPHVRKSGSRKNSSLSSAIAAARCLDLRAADVADLDGLFKVRKKANKKKETRKNDVVLSPLRRLGA